MNEGSFILRGLDRLLLTPAPPRAMEAHGVRVIQPGPGYVRYRLCYWAVAHVGQLVLVAIFMLGVPFFRKGGQTAMGKGVWTAVTKTFDSLAGPKGLALNETMRTVLATLLIALLILVVLAILFNLVAGILLCRLDARRRWYVLAERTLTVREGLVNVREMTFTYANIQDVRLTAGPLCRFFGIADVTVETAGGGAAGGGDAKVAAPLMHRATLAGLANAEEVRDELISRQHRWQDTPSPQSQPSSEDAAIGTSKLLRDLTAEANSLRIAAERLSR